VSAQHSPRTEVSNLQIPFLCVHPWHKVWLHLLASLCLHTSLCAEPTRQRGPQRSACIRRTLLLPGLQLWCGAAAVMTTAVNLCCYCHSCGATVKHVAKWEPYSTETVFTGTFLCSTGSKRKTNVVHYTGSLILSDNYLLQLPVGSFIVLTSSLRKTLNARRRRNRK
jgi:hypothetical protein